MIESHQLLFLIVQLHDRLVDFNCVHSLTNCEVVELFFDVHILFCCSKQMKDFALDIIGNLRFRIAVIRKITHCAADCFPFCISEKFRDRAKISGCFVHDCIIADFEVDCKQGCASSPTGFLIRVPPSFRQVQLS